MGLGIDLIEQERERQIHREGWSSEHDDKRQNVTFRYRYTIKENIEDIKLTSKNSEEEEVSSIKWIPIDDIDNYKWAFNHDKIIKEEV